MKEEEREGVEEKDGGMKVGEGEFKLGGVKLW